MAPIFLTSTIRGRAYREPFIQLNCMALLEKVDDHLTVADALAIDLDSLVLALRPFARVRFINLLIGKPRKLKPNQELQSERADGGQTPIWRKGEDFQGGHAHSPTDGDRTCLAGPAALIGMLGDLWVEPPKRSPRHRAN